jgi:hypothetical protein
VRPRLLALPLILALTGCGSGSGGLDYQLRTPPPFVGGAPVAPPGQKPVDREMTRTDARRYRAVIANWANAVRAGNVDRAAHFFDLPAIVSQPGRSALQVNTPLIAQAFNASLPCGAKLIGTNPDGRYVVATFVLVRKGGPCPGAGHLARVGFVFGDLRHPRRFTEWWQASSAAGKVGPDKRPRALTPATVADFG